MDRHYIAPSRPLASAVAEWLADRACDTPSGVAALDSFFVVVPTREAGRRLRIALARVFETRGGVIPPKIGLPNHLLVPAATGTLATASHAECLAAVAKTISSLGRDECTALRPPRTRQRDTFSLAMRDASAIVDVQNRLAQGALLCADVPAVLENSGAPREEIARWQDLALIETRVFETLHANGLEHPSEARRRAVSAPARPAGIEKVVLPALPDAPPAFFKVLAKLEASGIKIELLLHCSPEEGRAFDEWGLPSPSPDSPWSDASRLRFPISDSQIFRRPDSAAQATAVASAWVAASEDSAGSVALGMVDTALRPALQSAFLSRGVSLHDPSNRPLRETSLGRVSSLLAEMLGEDPDFATLSAFLRETDVAARLAREGRSHAAMLAALDGLQRRHLPRTVSDIRHFISPDTDLHGLFSDLDALLAPSEGVEDGSPAHFASVLARLFDRRVLRDGDTADKNLGAASEAVREAVRGVASRAVSAMLSHAERSELLRNMLSEASFPMDASPGDVPLLGWLELAWCDEPRIVIAGFNEGSVPQSVVGDPFLPDSLLHLLGLPDNARRFARDAFLFSEILSCRANGAVRVFFEKINSRGDARKPSRLLFACSDEVLAKRVDRLFADLDRIPDIPRGNADSAWPLALPPPPPPPESIPVTLLSGYFKSPFQWFVDRELGSEEAGTDPAAEIPVNDFGSICHAALEAFAAPGAPNESDNPDEIYAFLEAKIRSQIWARYSGRDRSLVAAVRLQERSALARMRTFADIQAGLVRDGWRIRHAEVSLAMVVAGVKITGKADRIDENVITGEWRVLDYKTWTESNKWKSALSRLPPPGLGPLLEENDIQRVVVDTPPGEGLSLRSRTESHYWADPQLPLYVIFAKADPKLGIPQDAIVSCKYLVLGDSSKDSGLVGLDAPTDEGLELALRETSLAVRRIKAGIFIPHEGLAGAELSDAIREILPDGHPENGIAPAWLEDQKRRAVKFGDPQ